MAEEIPLDEIIVFCFNCTLQIQRNVYIKCAECPSAVCVPCFQFGAESRGHKRGHNYEVIDPYGFSSCSGDWGYLEESRLITTMHKYKMGNWGEIVENMKSNRRDVSDAQDYFDKIFVRGWIGQFAIKGGAWHKTKAELLRGGRLNELMLPQSDSTERLLMIRDALRDYEDSVNGTNPKLLEVVDEILQDYLERLKNGEIDLDEAHVEVEEDESPTISYDEFDPSEAEEEKPKGRKQKETKVFEKLGLEEEVESEDERFSPPPRKMMRCGPSSNRRGEKKESKYRRIQKDSSSEDDEFVEDETYGLEKEETSSEGDPSDASEDVKKGRKCARRRGRRTDRLSKKERRNLAFLKRMSVMNKKYEMQQLQEVESVCPLSEMKELRDALPRLALETNHSLKERPKMRIDDLRMVAYNVDREEFEHEWFNDAEQLISRLTISAAPSEKDLWLEAENEIKFARIQLYNRVLSARKAKRNAIVEHDKITEFFNFMKDTTVDKRTPTQMLEDRTEMEKIAAKMQQFLTKEEHREFTEMIERLDTLKGRITHLQELQRKGETMVRAPPPSVTSTMKRKKKPCSDRRRKAQRCWDAFKRHHKSHCLN